MNNADDAEIAVACTDEVKDLIARAVSGVRFECQPASDAQLTAAVTRIAALIGQDWNKASRDEWIALVALELEDLPHVLVLDSLTRARRFVTAGRMLVAWVTNDIASRVARLEMERDQLERLAAIAIA